MRRGDVVLADFPFQDIAGGKIRPAIIVQADDQPSANTILAMVTGHLMQDRDETMVLVDPSSPEGFGSGLRGPSIIKCRNIATLRKQRFLRVIGQLNDVTMRKVDSGLSVALGLRQR